MGGTLIGGKRAARTNLQRYGKDYYHKLGKVGGSHSPGGGFRDRELASAAGVIGGLKSRRKDSRDPANVADYALEQARKHLLEVQRKAQHSREVASIE